MVRRVVVRAGNCGDARHFSALGFPAPPPGDARCGSRNTAVDMEVDEVVAVEAMEVGAEEGSPDAGMGEMAMLFSLRSSQ